VDGFTGGSCHLHGDCSGCQVVQGRFAG
jgi:hypothetical protein